MRSISTWNGLGRLLCGFPAPHLWNGFLTRDSWGGFINSQRKTGFATRTTLLLALILTFADPLPSPAQQPAPSSQSTDPRSIEDEVLANLLDHRIGDKTLADLAYPEDFLRRVADRIIRESFERRFRIVVDEEEKPTTQSASAPASAPAESALPENLTIQANSPSPASNVTSHPTSNAGQFACAATGFQLATESGEHAIAAFRLQLTRGSDWIGPGDGGAVDIARQLVTQFETPATIQFESKFLPELRPIATRWAASRKSPIALILQDKTLAQWAQDNTKPGWLRGENGAPRPVWFMPRFATRGDVGGVDIPGESQAVERFAAGGARVLRSSLLFQGGNLICARDPKSGKRLLLIGEAEIARNLQFGWSRQQIVDAFQAEMGVDRCVVLPAVSYHLDLELNLRVVGDRLIAFVVDADAGRRHLLTAGIGALRSAELLDQVSAENARAALAEGRTRDFMNTVGQVIMGHALEFGAYPKTLADKFSKGPADSGVGNFLIILHAMDSLLATSLKSDEVPQDRPGGYLRAIRRSEEARAALHKELNELGMQVVKVPAISNGDRGINPINCVHSKDAVLLPVWGGLFTDFDEAAVAAYRGALGPNVRILPVLSSETQRRGGGLHCAVGVQPAP